MITFIRSRCLASRIALILFSLHIPLSIYASTAVNDPNFIYSREEYDQKLTLPNALVIASTGRSGSTLLFDQLKNYASPQYDVYKTHLLPPSTQFDGKIIFVFSNPDKAAESALNMTMTRPYKRIHFSNLESTDRIWLERLAGKACQTEEDNLLAYDGLGTAQHLKEWLLTKTIPTTLAEANILAIKYEHLWDMETIAAIKEFLQIPEFDLPPFRPRGKSYANKPNIIAIKQLYNQGSDDEPLYQAYDEARPLWKAAPPFQYLKLRPTLAN